MGVCKISPKVIYDLQMDTAPVLGVAAQSQRAFICNAKTNLFQFSSCNVVTSKLSIQNTHYPFIHSKYFIIHPFKNIFPVLKMAEIGHSRPHPSKTQTASPNHMEITHGLFKSHTGSSQITLGDSIAIVTIQGPYEAAGRMDGSPRLSIDLRLHNAMKTDEYEAHFSDVFSKILEQYVVVDMDPYKCLEVHIYTNTSDLCLICNGLLVACIDGGIPLRQMFYGIRADCNHDCDHKLESGIESSESSGSNGLLVYAGNGELEMHHRCCEKSNSSAEDSLVLSEIQKTKERVMHGIRDMLSFQ